MNDISARHAGFPADPSGVANPWSTRFEAEGSAGRRRGVAAAWRYVSARLQAVARWLRQSPELRREWSALELTSSHPSYWQHPPASAGSSTRSVARKPDAVAWRPPESLLDARHLELGQVAAFEHAAGRVVTVTDGVIWVTQGDQRDILLAAGESCLLDGPGPAVLNPLLGPATFQWEHVEHLSGVAGRSAAA
ncbi:MAG: DUF2917 domain-containing protein [bacterium]|jgi:hypothetical protein